MHFPVGHLRLMVCLGSTFVLGGVGRQELLAQAIPPGETAKLTSGQLDALMARGTPPSVSENAAGDESFLRRATFDLIGRQPTLAEQRDFAANSSPDKRPDLIERLLASPEFGANWANYWRDTIAFRIPPPELTYLNYGPLTGWLAQQLNANTPWDQMAHALLTATGKIEDQPAATFIAYHQANPTNLAAETSRIFLGQQILCAQCHDHPFDSWKRTQFHELAAFFARTKAKLSQNDGAGTVVSSADKGEYLMPDMDPAKKGSPREPVFLLGQAIEAGQADSQRRARLAAFVASKDNPWFAKAYTNRIWARLMGRGFYEPVDDLGDSRPHQLPAVHDALARHFAATDFDIKDLFRLVMNSEAYRDPTRFGAIGGNPLESAHGGQPLRLRGDEVFSALATGIDLPNATPDRIAPTDAVRFPPPPKSTRDLVNEAFGSDPSLAPVDAPRTMSQALWMMNNEQLQKQINAAPGAGTMLSKLLEDERDDQAACQQLFKRVFSRSARPDELRIVAAHIAKVGDRRAAFEDILWSLVNSAEFSTRR